MNLQQFSTLFPIGAHLCRQPMPPMSEMKADMENLRRHGFNLVKLQEHWAWDEPLEGEYDFSVYEELIDYAGKLDLGVYLGFTCEQAPVWLWRKHPDCRMIGRNGLPIAYEATATLPCDGKPGPCFDHAGARADMVRFLTQAVQTLGAYENLVVWNTWQETGYWAEFLAGQHVCYCPNTLQFYRKWLGEKYGDLDGVNRAWGTRFGEWDYVAPDRSANGRESLPQDIDWRFFMDNVQISRVLKTRCEAIKAADPLQRPVFAHKGGPQIGSGQDWNLARCQDFLGSSAYPAWGVTMPWDDEYPGDERIEKHTALLNEVWDTISMRFDYLRCSNRPGAPVWAAEFQGGPVSTRFQKGRVPDAADIRRWMLSAVASGTTAISFWVTRLEIMSSEANGFGLLDSVGDDTPRFAEAARVGAALNNHADLFAQSTTPTPTVGIFIDENLFNFTTNIKEGGENLPYSVRGWYRLLWDAGIPVDFVCSSTLDERPLADYRAIIMPLPLAHSEETAGKLAEYVNGGGNLICEAAPGRLDEHGFCRRGELSPTLAALFGVQHKGFQLVREPGDAKRWSPRERTWGEYRNATMLTGVGLLAGGELRANLYLETYALAGGEACLRAGEEIAGVTRAVGAGHAWLIGTYIGHGGTAHRDNVSRALVLNLLAQCGITPAHPGKFLLRKRVTKSKEAWFFTNPKAETMTEKISIAGYVKVTDLLGEPLSITNSTVSLTVESMDVQVLIMER